jgi:hypothetical protein
VPPVPFADESSAAWAIPAAISERKIIAVMRIPIFILIKNAELSPHRLWLNLLRWLIPSFPSPKV